MNKLKILAIAYYAPPCGKVGVVRMAKLIKYLMRLGHDITLVSAKDSGGSQANQTWLNDIKGANRIEIPLADNLLKKLDAGLHWYYPLKTILIKHLSQNSYDVSLWTGSPFFHWRIAPILKKRFKLPYVLDFRDPWFLYPYRKKIPVIGKLRTLIYGHYENIALKEASFAINVSQQGSVLYQTYYKKMPAKFICIPNGFDPEDVPKLEGNSKNNKPFLIVYTGRFSNFRNPRPFLSALKKLITNKKLTPNDIVFRVISEPEKRIVDIVTEMELNAYFENTGFLPYNQALQKTAEADLCLLITGDNPLEQTTKIFDYLYLKKKVLAISPTDGFITELLEDSNTPALKQSTEDIFTRIEQDYTDHEPTKIATEILQKYNREVIAKTFEEYLYCASSRS